jgi:hypothetical protein
MNGCSLPNQANNEKSTVSRGSPQRCNASPPMKQNFHWLDSQISCSSAAA